MQLFILLLLCLNDHDLCQVLDRKHQPRYCSGQNCRKAAAYLDLISFVSPGGCISSVFIRNVFTDVGYPDMKSLWWRSSQEFGIQNRKKKKSTLRD